MGKMEIKVDRRQDVGLKIVYVILTALITLLLTVFFNKTYTIAEQALAMSNDNKKDVAVIQQCIKGIDLSLTKMDLKLDTLLTLKSR
jgi:hypothetical protein